MSAPESNTEGAMSAASSVGVRAARERPILFSAPMVRALLDGRKTQTRRIVRPQPHDPALGIYGPPSMINGTGSYMQDHLLDEGFDGGTSPYGDPGDRLWVRETWAPEVLDGGDHRVVYRADRAAWWSGVNIEARTAPMFYLASGYEPKAWRPSIHMPRWASRITLEVTGVRVERVQDISEADAIAEGASSYDEETDPPPPDSGHEWSYRASFLRLFYDLNARAPRDSNPWVWVVEFRKAQMPTADAAQIAPLGETDD